MYFELLAAVLGSARRCGVPFWFAAAPSALQPLLLAMLVARGHSRDGKRDDLQIVFGLVCNAQGCPVAVDVFPGNTADPATVAAQVAKLKDRFARKQEAIAAEAALDGLYVIRTRLPDTAMDAEAAVAAYKSLAHVERAFFSIKTVDREVRPVFHYNAQRVRAHVFLCMLAYPFYPALGACRT